jgi:pSer/pThr/pTyr-binding forkhead associated (FHA) protein
VDLKPYSVSIARGHGLVARYGDAVMYIADETASARRLLTAIDGMADVVHPGAGIAARLAALSCGAHAPSAPFGLVAPTADGLLVILRGSVAVEISDADGTRTLSADNSLVLRDPVHSVVVTVAGASRQSDCPQTDLCAGVVPGGGFILRRAAATAPRWPRQSGPDETQTRKREAPTQRVRLPARPATAETSALAFAGGVLASDDGAAYPLDRAYVIGRNPLGDNAVRTARASPIVMHDDANVSRVHAYVGIDGSAVFVRDAATSGGTFIAAPGAGAWTQIGTAPIELEPGWSLRIGGHIFTYRKA